MLKRVLFLLILFSTSIAYSTPNNWEFAGWYGGGCFPNVAFDPNVKDRVYLTSDVTGIWRSDDSGDHWYFINNGLGHLIVSQVIVAPSDSNILYAATGNGVYLSRDAGSSWKSTNTANNQISFKRPDNYKPIAVDITNPAHVCAGTAKGKVFCSNNFGSSWNDVTKQYNDNDKPISVLLFNKDNQLVVSQDSDVIQLNDVTILKTSSLNVPKGKLYRFTVDETNQPPTLYGVWNENWNGGIIVSRDLGQTWENIDEHLNGDTKADPSRHWASSRGKSTAIAINPFNPQMLIKTDWWGVWRTDDGGSSWNEKIIGAPNTVATQVIIGETGDILVASMDNGLMRSQDQGKTYEPLFPTKGFDSNKNGHVWRAAYAGNDIIATSTPWNTPLNQTIKSTDNGATFDIVRNGLPNFRPKQNTMWGEGYARALAVDPNNHDIIYLGMDGDEGGGLFVSHDRGSSWQRSTGHPDALRIYNALVVDPTDSNRLLWGACGKGGGVYISNDRGKTFTRTLTAMQWVFGATISPDGTMYAAGDSNGPKLYVSKDHGKTWQLTGDFKGQGRALVAVAVDPTNPKKIVTGTVNWDSTTPTKIFLSEDGGKKWEDITGNLPNGAGVSSFAFDTKNNYLYITRYADSVYKLKL